MQLTVYIQKNTPRIAYAFSLLFEHVVKLPYQLTEARAEAHLAYTPRPEPGIPLWLPALGLLSVSGIRDVPVELFQHDGKAAFFGCPSAAALFPFDLPAMAFYLASRYEEYLPAEKDHHRRFPARSSLAFKGGFLRQPLINKWGLALAQRLQEHFPELALQRPVYRFRPSYDVDMAWAYRERPAWLQGASAARDVLRGDWSRLQQRWLISLGKADDPFDTFEYLNEWHKRLGLSPLYFFLLGDYRTYDKNINPKRPAFRRLLQELAKTYDTGLHPSYASNNSSKQLAKECRRFHSITGEAPKRSRQHYLKLEFPSTYRALLREGISADYTMGFADEVGFRASLATPFPWYDLQRECVQDITVYPFALMDGSLRHYMQLEPEQAIAAIAQLVGEIRATGGLFIPLWHNSSFSVAHGWGGWQQVFEWMLAYAKAD